MITSLAGLEGYLPSIKVQNFVLEENEQELIITLNLVAIDIVDKNGNLFWGVDFDLSQYIKYSIFFNINGQSIEQDLYSTLYDPTLRIQNIYNNMRNRGVSASDGASTAFAALAENVKLLKPMNAKTLVDRYVSGVNSVSSIRSTYYNNIYPVAINEGMDNFRPLESMSAREDANIGTLMSKYETLDAEGRSIYKIPAEKVLRIEKSRTQRTAGGVLRDESGDIIQRLEPGFITSDKFPDGFNHMSCYIFSIFDLDQLMEDQNINHLPMDIKDRIGSALTYDLVIRDGKINDSGDVFKYRDQDGYEKTWFGPYHLHTAENPGPDNYIGFMGGTAGNHGPPIYRTPVVNTKIQDLRRFSGRTGLPMPENLAELYRAESAISQPTWLAQAAIEDGSGITFEYSLISGTDEVANMVLPSLSGMNPKTAKDKFQNLYKSIEMQKYSQGNSSLYGKIFLDQTSENHVNYILFIDMFNLYKNHSKFSIMLETDARGDGVGNYGSFNDLNDAMYTFKVESLRLYRRRVTNKLTGINSFGYPEHEVVDNNEIPYLVAEISQRTGYRSSSGPLYTSQVSDDLNANDDNEIEFTRKSTMRYVDVNAAPRAKRDKNVDAFTGTDFSVSQKGGGTYQYYIEIDFRDLAYEKFVERYKQLIIDIEYIQTLYYNTYQLYNASEKAYDRSIMTMDERMQRQVFVYRSEPWEQFLRIYNENLPLNAHRDVGFALGKIREACNEIISILYSRSGSLKNAFKLKFEQFEMANPFKPQCTPQNQQIILSFLNDLKINFEAFLEIGNVPKTKYSSENSADAMGNDTSDIGRITVTNYFSEYVQIDKSIKNFNLAYFGDIFEDPENHYGIPIINIESLQQRLALSQDRFRVTEGLNSSSKIILEPRFFNSSLSKRREREIPETAASLAQTQIYHREEQDPIVRDTSPLYEMTVDADGATRTLLRHPIFTKEDIESVYKHLYESGVLSLNPQSNRTNQKPVKFEDLRSVATNGDIRKVKEVFERIYFESMRDFASELGISLYTNDFPVPTAFLGEAIRKDSSNELVNELANISDIKSQKSYIGRKVYNEVLSSLTEQNPGVDLKFLNKFGELFHAILMTNHDRYLNGMGITTEREEILTLVENINQAIENRTRDVIPPQLANYIKNGRMTIAHETYAPHSQLFIDSFKELRMLYSIHVGDLVASTFGMQEFLSVGENQLRSILSNGQMRLIKLEQFTDDELGIGYSKISQVPVATTYFLLKDGGSGGNSGY